MSKMSEAVDLLGESGELDERPLAAAGAVARERVLCARLVNFKVDVARLREHFEQQVKRVEPTPYRDNRVDYLGWAVTSRDGSIDDGVKRIPTKGASGKTADGKGNKRGVTRTPICTGYLAEVIDQLQELDLAPYRARFMLLESEGELMPFHTDAAREAWRLHIPLVTNPEALFEWQLPAGGVESVHLPADGSAWLVRVDIRHRAINLNGAAGGRVHLLMGLGKPPAGEQLAAPHRVLPA